MVDENKKKVEEEWKQHVEEVQLKTTGVDSSGSKLPEASFMLFLAGITTQAFIQLGEVDNPITKKNEQNLTQAKYTIDMINILEEKTMGNLSDEEKKYLDSALFDLRSRYLKKIK